MMCMNRNGGRRHGEGERRPEADRAGVVFVEMLPQGLDRRHREGVGNTEELV